MSWGYRTLTPPALKLRTMRVAHSKIGAKTSDGSRKLFTIRFRSAGSEQPLLLGRYRGESARPEAFVGFISYSMSEPSAWSSPSPMQLRERRDLLSHHDFVHRTIPGFAVDDVPHPGRAPPGFAPGAAATHFPDALAARSRPSHTGPTTSSSFSASGHFLLSSPVLLVKLVSARRDELPFPPRVCEVRRRSNARRPSPIPTRTRC